MCQSDVIEGCFKRFKMVGFSCWLVFTFDFGGLINLQNGVWF